MSEIVVRSIKKDDFDEVIAMIHDAQTVSFKEISPNKLVEAKNKKYGRNALEARVAAGEYWVATDANGVIIGVIGLIEQNLRTFFVGSQQQGKGVGRKLFDTLEARARELHINPLKVYASDIGLPIYKHFGFKVIGEKMKERDGHTYRETALEKNYD